MLHFIAYNPHKPPTVRIIYAVWECLFTWRRWNLAENVDSDEQTERSEEARQTTGETVQ